MWDSNTLLIISSTLTLPRQWLMLNAAISHVAPQTRLPSAAHLEIANAERWREASPQHGVTPYRTASLYRVPETTALVRRYVCGECRSGAAIDSGRIRRMQE
jgi:hypothetical protein